MSRLFGFEPNEEDFAKSLDIVALKAPEIVHIFDTLPLHEQRKMFLETLGSVIDAIDYAVAQIPPTHRVQLLNIVSQPDPDKAHKDWSDYWESVNHGCFSTPMYMLAFMQLIKSKSKLLKQKEEEGQSPDIKSVNINGMDAAVEAALMKMKPTVFN
jgi:hypothetical protein